MSDLIKTILCIAPFAVAAVVYAISEFSDMYQQREFEAEIEAKPFKRETPAQRRARLGVK